MIHCIPHSWKLEVIIVNSEQVKSQFLFGILNIKMENSMFSTAVLHFVHVLNTYNSAESILQFLLMSHSSVINCIWNMYVCLCVWKSNIKMN